MKQVNWGIIGCGNVTEIKSGPAFNKVINSRLVAVMRRDATLAADYALRHSVPEWYSEADKIIADPEVNTVYIATPPAFHAEYAIKAMKAGKAVYVEKPMALNETECREMLSVSSETGQPLFVAYYRRALPYFVRIKELIDTGTIGEVQNVILKFHVPAKPEELDPSASNGWRVDPALSGGGHFHDMACHQLDFLLYLFGPVKKVSGTASNQAGLYAADDAAVASLEFESGVLMTGSWCFTVPEFLKTDQAEITGSQGKITFSFFGTPVIIIEKAGGNKETEEIPYPEHVQQPFIDTVVKSLLGDGECPGTGATAMETTILMDRITGG